MVDLLILLLFVGSGAAAGWLGIHLLPDQLVNPNTDAEELRLILTAAGGGAGLLAGLVFKRLRVRLMQQVRTMPTDLLVSRAVGLILGLLHQADPQPLEHQPGQQARSSPGRGQDQPQLLSIRVRVHQLLRQQMNAQPSRGCAGPHE